LLQILLLLLLLYIEDVTCHYTWDGNYFAKNVIRNT